MTVLVWQWGRFGAGPRFAAALADGLAALPGVRVELSLSAQAELLRGAMPPRCTLAFPTYAGLPGFLLRAAQAPLLVGKLAARLQALDLAAAVCAMPAPFDLLMAASLRRAGVPYAVVVHDAEPHPGSGSPLEMMLQRRLLRGAGTLVTLSQHVSDRLTAQGLARDKIVLLASHPPFEFGPKPPPPMAHGGKLRLLSFGRIRPYKGLDLLAEALRLLGTRSDLEVRVVGHGVETVTLRTLRRLPNVTVENRWVPEQEVAALLAWADALVLTYREASQSGVAAAAIAAGRWVIATRVGGLVEQLHDGALGLLCQPSPRSIADAILTLLARGAPGLAAVDSKAEWRLLAETLRPAIGAAP